MADAVPQPRTSTDPAARLAAAIASPYVPQALLALQAEPGYLDVLAPALERAARTAGFLGSALYMADMASDAVEEVYEPVLTTDDLRAAGVDAAQQAAIVATLDVFHWVQPQTLLLVAALAEAWKRPSVGGRGQATPRDLSERERLHLATRLRLADPGLAPLPEVAAVVGFAEVPEVYRAVAQWEGYLGLSWGELQHLAAYPQFRRRGRAIYFYARSAARFLAEPLSANREQFAAAGLPADSLDRLDGLLSTALPALATAMMHTCAMRVGLGVRTREVVQD